MSSEITEISRVRETIHFAFRFYYYKSKKNLIYKFPYVRLKFILKKCEKSRKSFLDKTSL